MINNISDDIFKETCTNILENGDLHSGRPVWQDGIKAEWLSVSSIVNKYDLSKEFPIGTLRPLNLKACIDEILWIYQKKSNNIKDLNSKIWDSWATPSTKNEIIYVRRKIKKPPTHMKTIKVAEIINENAPIKNSVNYGEFYVLEKDLKTNRYKIQFKNTGFINYVSQSAVSCCEVKDYYYRSVNGLGYYGNYKSKEILEYFGEYHKKWITTWENMVRRCSGVYSGNKEWYKDIFLDESFHSCENFLKWVMNNNRHCKDYLNILQIDKDYYSANYYGADSCTLLTPKENTCLTLDYWYKFKNKLFYSKSDLANYFKNELGLIKTHNPSGNYNDYNVNKYISTFKETEELEIINIKDPTSDGMFIRFPLENDWTVKRSYGYQLGIKHKYSDGEYDQVDRILKDLKDNPYNRRLITSFWSPKDIMEKPLLECAYSMTFVPYKDRLDGILNQRSNDVLVANNWNVCQYAILLHMFAQVSGFKVGTLTHVIADAHIYDKHIPLVKDLISRDSYVPPKLIINPNINNFYDFKVEDFTLENYQHGEQIKNIPVAI